jgi:hypothetical protein
MKLRRRLLPRERGDPFEKTHAAAIGTFLLFILAKKNKKKKLVVFFDKFCKMLFVV